MSRDLSANMLAHLAGDTHQLATMLRLDLVDGTTMAFTNHNDQVAFDLGDGEATYQPRTGIDVSAVLLTVGLEASNFEVSGPIGDLVTRTHVLGGRYRGAVARLFMVNWDALADGPVRLMKGHVGESRVEGSRFVMEVRGIAAAYNEPWGRVLNPLCTATFGDPTTGCPVALDPIAAVVTAVTDDFRFVLDLAGDHADDYFNLGTVEFTSGDLAGTVAGTVVDYDGGTSAVELLEPLVDTPQVGDGLMIARGCSKLLKSDDPTLPTCLSYDAVLDFRGWPEVPGTRFYHRVSAPGTSYA